MNPPTRRFLPIAAGLLLAVATLRGATPASTDAAATKTVDRFDRTKQRIDELLKRRLDPEPLPAVLANPFELTEEAPPANNARIPGNAPDQTVAPAKIDPPANFLQPGSDEEILARYLPTLRITGNGQLNGRSYLIINSTPYKEGDRILIINKNPQVYFSVIRIAPGEVTFGLNDVTQVLKFKN